MMYTCSTDNLIQNMMCACVTPLPGTVQLTRVPVPVYKFIEHL